ncbi:MAG: F0F1 ATP synthase subunit A [Actinobacteria bacterium]|nr:F0F1 ATP synthase subunit A [Actinomycetota bacterium]
MSSAVLALTHTADPGFEPPGIADFNFPPIFPNTPFDFVTKPLLASVLAAIIVFVFFTLGARKAALVPGRFQFAVESVYTFIRNGIARDVIGHDFAKYVPYLVTVFAFISVNNLFGIIPLIQFPTLARFGFPLVLAICSWLIYLGIGIRRAGFFGYFKSIMFPPGLPVFIYPLLAPIELIQVLVVRPFSLALRLTANMFAGHILLLLFTLGGTYMLTNESLVLKLLAPFSLAGAIGLTSFEAFIEVLQAYIFTLLSALYIAEAMSDEH